LAGWCKGLSSYQTETPGCAGSGKLLVKVGVSGLESLGIKAAAGNGLPSDTVICAAQFINVTAGEFSLDSILEGFNLCAKFPYLCTDFVCAHSVQLLLFYLGTGGV